MLRDISLPEYRLPVMITLLIISIVAVVLSVREDEIEEESRDCWLEATVVRCGWRTDDEAVQAGENYPRGGVRVPSGGGGRDATSSEAGRARQVPDTEDGRRE
jgi:hypothetical protein